MGRPDGDYLTKVIRTGAVCPIDPLYCDATDPHECFNEDTGQRAIVVTEADDEPDVGPPAPGEGDHLSNPEAGMKC
jgi:hypothetical protein